MGTQKGGVKSSMESKWSNMLGGGGGKHLPKQSVNNRPNSSMNSLVKWLAGGANSSHDTAHREPKPPMTDDEFAEYSRNLTYHGDTQMAILITSIVILIGIFLLLALYARLRDCDKDPRERSYRQNKRRRKELRTRGISVPSRQFPPKGERGSIAYSLMDSHHSFSDDPVHKGVCGIIRKPHSMMAGWWNKDRHNKPKYRQLKPWVIDERELTIQSSTKVPTINRTYVSAGYRKQFNDTIDDLYINETIGNTYAVNKRRQDSINDRYVLDTIREDGNTSDIHRRCGANYGQQRDNDGSSKVDKVTNRQPVSDHEQQVSVPTTGSIPPMNVRIPTEISTVHNHTVSPITENSSQKSAVNIPTVERREFNLYLPSLDSKPSYIENNTGRDYLNRTDCEFYSVLKDEEKSLMGPNLKTDGRNDTKPNGNLGVSKLESKPSFIVHNTGRGCINRNDCEFLADNAQTCYGSCLHGRDTEDNNSEYTIDEVRKVPSYIDHNLRRKSINMSDCEFGTKDINNPILQNRQQNNVYSMQSRLTMCECVVCEQMNIQEEAIGGYDRKQQLLVHGNDHLEPSVCRTYHYNEDMISSNNSICSNNDSRYIVRDSDMMNHTDQTEHQCSDDSYFTPTIPRLDLTSPNREIHQTNNNIQIGQACDNLNSFRRLFSDSDLFVDVDYLNQERDIEKHENTGNININQYFKSNDNVSEHAWNNNLYIKDNLMKHKLNNSSVCMNYGVDDDRNTTQPGRFESSHTTSNTVKQSNRQFTDYRRDQFLPMPARNYGPTFTAGYNGVNTRQGNQTHQSHLTPGSRSIQPSGELNNFTRNLSPPSSFNLLSDRSKCQVTNDDDMRQLEMTPHFIVDEHSVYHYAPLLVNGKW